MISTHLRGDGGDCLAILHDDIDQLPFHQHAISQAFSGQKHVRLDPRGAAQVLQRPYGQQLLVIVRDGRCEA